MKSEDPNRRALYGVHQTIRLSLTTVEIINFATSPTVGWDYRRSGLTLLGRVTMMDRDIAKSTFLPTIPRLLH